VCVCECISQNEVWLILLFRAHGQNDPATGAALGQVRFTSTCRIANKLILLKEKNNYCLLTLFFSFFSFLQMISSVKVATHRLDYLNSIWTHPVCDCLYSFCLHMLLLLIAPTHSLYLLSSRCFSRHIHNKTYVSYRNFNMKRMIRFLRIEWVISSTLIENILCIVWCEKCEERIDKVNDLNAFHNKSRRWYVCYLPHTNLSLLINRRRPHWFWTVPSK
jgi:hypothetical protein